MTHGWNILRGAKRAAHDIHWGDARLGDWHDVRFRSLIRRYMKRLEWEDVI